MINLARIRKFFYASQEFTLWLPGLVLLSVLGYVVLGSFVRLGGDAIAWLAELPVLCAYAAAWLGCGWLIKAVYLHDIPRPREIELQACALAGDLHAQWLIRQDRFETAGALVLALVFFWPPR
ncbi:hypothetical protein [uncultured Luteimonas sp.]|uniref:hypothetical protein n=1 Tax=uncultured Luteimonas sp. TaxID=453144 RepID=UPI00261B67DD|nr:hypothetical protein [uncultured Luteimonas sp.]